MRRIKINSIGFGHSRDVILSEGLTIAGVGMIIAGIVINWTMSEWMIGANSDTIDGICKLYNAINS